MIQYIKKHSLWLLMLVSALAACSNNDATKQSSDKVAADDNVNLPDTTGQVAFTAELPTAAEKSLGNKDSFKSFLSPAAAAYYQHLEDFHNSLPPEKRKVMDSSLNENFRKTDAAFSKYKK